MPYPKDGPAANAYAALSAIAQKSAELRQEAETILSAIDERVIGQRVRAFGHIYEVCTARIHPNGGVRCYGVRVNKKGEVGSRGYDIGMLEDCEFLTPDAKP